MIQEGITMTDKAPLASSKEIADYLGITENNLARIRMEGNGPEFIRVGHRNIRYRWSAVEAWLDEQSRTSTSV